MPKHLVGKVLKSGSSLFLIFNENSQALRFANDWDGEIEYSKENELFTTLTNRFTLSKVDFLDDVRELINKMPPYTKTHLMSLIFG